MPAAALAAESATTGESGAHLSEGGGSAPELPLTEPAESSSPSEPDSGTLDLSGVPGLTETAETETPALNGLAAEDVLDLGGGELPLPGEDAPEALPDSVAVTEFYAPPVPDVAMTVAQELEDALQP